VTRPFQTALFAAILAIPTTAWAQPPRAAGELRELEQRLQAAERRLQRLEANEGAAVQITDNAPVSQTGWTAPPLPQVETIPTEVPSSSPGAIELVKFNNLERPWVYAPAITAPGALDDEPQPVSPLEPTFEMHGRIHADSWSFLDDSEGIHWFENPDTGVDPEDRLFFRRVRLEMGGDVYFNVLWRIQVEFSSPEAPQFKDVYIGFTHVPVLQTVLVGIQKRPLGLDQLNSTRFNVFMERPLVVDAFNEDIRRLGVMAYGISDDERYHWRYGIFNLENIQDDGESIGDSLQLSANARLSSSPWYDERSGGRGYFHWAVAGMLAHPDGDVDPDDTNENEGRVRTRSELRSDERWLDTGRIAGAQWYEIAAVESIVNVGPLQVVGEYQNTWLQRDETTPGTGPDLFFHGAYIYVAYMLTGEHVPYDRGSGTIDRVEPFEDFFLVDRCDEGCGRGWGAWQVALRYSYLDLTDQDIRGGVEHNVTFGLVWYFNPFASLQVNAIYGEIRDHEPVEGFADGHFTALGTRLRMEF
jgi:phosphate-selective porin OprO/OprP